MLDIEIFTEFAAGSLLDQEAASMAEVDAIALAALCEAAGDADDPGSLATLPEAPGPVLEAARAAFTAPDAAAAIATLYAGHCQPRRVEIDDYDADGHGGLLVPDAWPIGKGSACFDLGALSTAAREGGPR